MNTEELLLWEKYRPKTMEDIILLPRIKKRFENGLDNNYIFYGNFGTGKTSLAKILSGFYKNDVATLYINSSLDRKIETLRTEIDDFCKHTPLFDTKDSYKYVILDEFEKVSSSFQDGFRGFIEKYNKSVRFILTTNYINKISGGIDSRIKRLNFNAIDKKEEKYLKTEFFKKIKNEILPKEEKTIKKDQLVNVINSKFPDFRNTLVELQDLIDYGEDESTQNINNQLKLKLYDVIYDQDITYDKIYHFLMSEFGADNIDSLFTMLGRSFINWSINNNKNIDKLFNCNYVISDYQSKLNENTDPIILGMTVIGKIKNIMFNELK